MICFTLFTFLYFTLLYFIFVYLIFMSQIVLYFLHCTSVISFYIDVELTLSIRKTSVPFFYNRYTNTFKSCKLNFGKIAFQQFSYQTVLGFIMDGRILLTSALSCVVSPRDETTNSEVDFNNTRPSMIDILIITRYL